MTYDKTGQFELKRDVGLFVLCVGLLCRCFYFKYIVLFNILNPVERKNKLKIGFGHHVEGKIVDVNRNSNMGRKKSFKVGSSSCEGDRKCVEGDRNCIEGDRFLLNVDGNRDAGRGKWNNGSRKTINVKGKCFIVSKKNKISKK